MATVQPRTYDPNKVVCSFKGNIITGYGKDSRIEAERSEDLFTTQVGCDGEFARSLSRNKSGTVKITLLATSPTNDVLSAALALDELTGAGAGELGIEDTNGTSLAHTSVAWVKKMVPLKRGKEVEENEWTLECGQLDLFIGGSSIVVA